MTSQLSFAITFHNILNYSTRNLTKYKSGVIIKYFIWGMTNSAVWKKFSTENNIEYYSVILLNNKIVNCSLLTMLYIKYKKYSVTAILLHIAVCI